MWRSKLGGRVSIFGRNAVAERRNIKCNELNQVYLKVLQTSHELQSQRMEVSSSSFDTANSFGKVVKTMRYVSFGVKTLAHQQVPLPLQNAINIGNTALYIVGVRYVYSNKMAKNNSEISVQKFLTKLKRFPGMEKYYEEIRMKFPEDLNQMDVFQVSVLDRLREDKSIKSTVLNSIIGMLPTDISDKTFSPVGSLSFLKIAIVIYLLFQPFEFAKVIRDVTINEIKYALTILDEIYENIRSEIEDIINDIQSVMALSFLIVKISEIVSVFSEMLNNTDETVRSLLHFAVLNYDLPTCKLLTDLGYDIDARDVYGRTPLMYSAVNGALPISRFLLDRGADIHATDKDNKHSIYHASKWNNEDIVEYLLDKGANENSLYDFKTELDPRNNLGMIDSADDDSSYDSNVSNVIQRAVVNASGSGVVSKMSETPANTDGVNQTLLHLAVSSHTLPICESLVNLGVDIDARDVYGRTPLMYAAVNGALPILQFLLRSGADIHATDKDNKPAIYHASKWNNEDIVDYLLDKGANKNSLYDFKTELDPRNNLGMIDSADHDDCSNDDDSSDDDYTDDPS